MAVAETWYAYILRCADDSYYAGVTTDLERRLREHNQDDQKGAKYTRARRPVVLVYHESFETRAEATRREWAIKRMKRAAKHRLVLGYVHG